MRGYQRRIYIFIIGRGIHSLLLFHNKPIIRVLPASDQTGYNNIIWAENGLVEQLQVIFLLISIFLLIKFIRSNVHNFHIYSRLIIFLYLIGVAYYFFEEISKKRSGRNFFRFWQC